MYAFELSRKLKKKIFGKRITKSKLKNMLSNVKIIDGHLESDPFCPKCGCIYTHSSGNMVGYPEIWVKEYCALCGFHVGGADNSPYYHSLELGAPYVI